jgi:hypothetical protein
MLNILQAIVIACLCIVPQPSTVLRESVAAVERNFYFDDAGRLIFEQVLFVDVVAGDEQIVAWRLIKDPAIVPKRDWQTGGYVATWMDGEQVRQVRTNSTRETFTQFDPETAARETLPQEKRRGLTQQTTNAKIH